MSFIYLHKKIIYKNLLKSFIYLLKKKKFIKKKACFYKKGKNGFFVFFKGCHEVPTYPAIRRSNRT